MLDLKFIRKNRDLVAQAIQDKNLKFDLDKLLTLDETVRDSKTKIENLLSAQNKLSKDIPKAQGEDKQKLLQEANNLSQEIAKIKPALKQLEDELEELLLLVPNIPEDTAPKGRDEHDNVEVKTYGVIPNFNFAISDHVDIVNKNSWADFEAIATISGNRSYMLKNTLVMYELALIHYALDKLVKRKFNVISMPAFVREQPLIGTGHFPSGKEQVYYLPDDNIYLSGTSEVQANSLHSNQILEDASMPLLYAGYSACFRREAGSYGKDVRGFMRVHQFNKVEQFVFCRNNNAESSYWHQELLTIAEEILQELELPYRVVECCTGDMGVGKVKMYDLEAWVPSEKRYRETHSCSKLHDWQARRTNTRYRDTDGKVQFCHTLNNTAIATPRIFVPLLENHQLPDGRIKIPGVLRGYMGNREYLNE